MPPRLTPEQRQQRADQEISDVINKDEPVTGAEILELGDPGACPKLYTPSESPAQFHGKRLSNSERAMWATLYNKVCYERIGSQDVAGKMATWVIIQKWVEEGVWDPRDPAFQLEKQDYYSSRDQRKQRRGKFPERGRYPTLEDYRDVSNEEWQSSRDERNREEGMRSYKDEFSDVEFDEFSGDPDAEDLLNQALSGDIQWKSYSPRNLRRASRRLYRSSRRGYSNLSARSLARRNAYASAIRKLKSVGILPR
jgi:hypothetical protein